MNSIRILAAIVFLIVYGIAGEMDYQTEVQYSKTPQVDKMKKDDWKKPHFNGCLNMEEPYKSMCIKVQSLKLTFEY